MTKRAAACVGLFWFFQSSTAFAELTLELESTADRYAGTVVLQQAPEVGPFQPAWLTVTTKDGTLFAPSLAQLSGGMPAHGHGLPSATTLTPGTTPGTYGVQGLRFNMTGEWVLKLYLVGPHGPDTLRTTFRIGATTDEGPATTANVVGTLSLSNLADPTDPSNRLLGDPTAAQLGQTLFNDEGLSGTGTMSCATCHQAHLQFTDKRSRSVGVEVLARNSPSLIGSAHSRWQYWDGRRDSLWAQAITPLEIAGEMHSNRTDIARYVTSRYAQTMRELYAQLFGSDLDDEAIPAFSAGPFGEKEEAAAWQHLNAASKHQINRIFSIVGKSLAAYLATLDHQENRLDRYIDQMAESDRSDLLSTSEARGLDLFLDMNKTRCMQCHNGPLLSNLGFHNIGTGPDGRGGFDYGRGLGARAVAFDPFNCRGPYSDAGANGCQHLDHIGAAEMGAFKVPSLRGVIHTGPYFHDGRFETLEEVVEYYRAPPPANEVSHELIPLELSDSQAADLVAFLKAL